MSKKITAILMAIIMVGTLAACGNSQTDKGQSNNAQPNSSAEQKTTTTKAPADRSGEWKQKNGDKDNYQIAKIANGTIEIYWHSEEDESDSLYWAGTYDAPTTADEPYTWDSKNDTEKTDNALLASSDATKTFTYEDGEISYQASALGTTKTIRLEKVK